MNQGSTRINWDSDVIKHYVRTNAWLPAVTDQVNKSLKAGRDPTYLTFCAGNAIDVFMLLREGVLKRDSTTNLVTNTYFCEKNPGEFNEISNLIGSREQGFLGDFQEIVLFEDDSETKGISISDISRRFPADIRRKLNAKERHIRLRQSIPFDVINFDLCGTFFPPRSGLLSPTLQSLKRLFDWQSEAAGIDESFNSFTLLVTTHVEKGGASEEAVQRLIELMRSNLEANQSFTRSLHERFGAREIESVADSDFEDFYCVALPKLIVREATDRGWIARSSYLGRYRRTRVSGKAQEHSTYWMLAWVGQFDMPAQLELTATSIDEISTYNTAIQELVRVPENVNHICCNRNDIRNSVQSNLSDVVAMRTGYTGLFSPAH